MTVRDDADQEIVEIINPEGRFPGLMVCDHAASAVPEEFDRLGLAPEDLERHIGVDIGIADVVRIVARQLDMPAVLTRYSRLLIDCNRCTGDPRLIVAESDGIAIPGNVGLTLEKIEHRIDSYFWPYHRAVDAAVRKLASRHAHPFMLFMHSCTRQLGTEYRPWDAGTIWNEANCLSSALIEALGRDRSLAIGDNQPYTGRGGAFSLDFHSWGTGIPACGLEIINDGIRSPEGIGVWGKRMAVAIGRLGEARDEIWARHHEQVSAPKRALAS